MTKESVGAASAHACVNRKSDPDITILASMSAEAWTVTATALVTIGTAWQLALDLQAISALCASCNSKSHSEIRSLPWHRRLRISLFKPPLSNQEIARLAILGELDVTTPVSPEQISSYDRRAGAWGLLLIGALTSLYGAIESWPAWHTNPFTGVLVMAFVAVAMVVVVHFEGRRARRELSRQQTRDYRKAPDGANDHVQKSHALAAPAKLQYGHRFSIFSA